MARSTTTAAPAAGATVPPQLAADAWRIACEAADVLAAMTPAERRRAYRSRVFGPARREGGDGDERETG